MRILVVVIVVVVVLSSEREKEREGLVLFNFYFSHCGIPPYPFIITLYNVPPFGSPNLDQCLHTSVYGKGGAYSPDILHIMMHFLDIVLVVSIAHSQSTVLGQALGQERLANPPGP